MTSALSTLTSMFMLFGTASFIVMVVFIFFHIRQFKSSLVKTRVAPKLVIGIGLGLLAIYGTIMGTRLESGTIINVRELAAMIAGVTGGPIAGLLAGLIGGLHRYTVGGVTALPCTVSTTLSGLISGIVSLKLTAEAYLLKGAALGFFLESGAMGLILVLLQPFSTALNIVEIIAVPMIAANTLGLVFWLFFSKKFISAP